MNNETAGKTCPQKREKKRKRKKKRREKKRISINYANLCLFRSMQKTAHQKVVKAAKSPNVAMPEMDGNKLCNNSVHSSEHHK